MIHSETGWDLAPFAAVLQCLYLHKFVLQKENTNLSSRMKTKQNKTVCMHNQGKFWTKDTKRPQIPTATSEEPGAKIGYFYFVRSKSRVLSLLLALNTSRGVDKPPKPPSGPIPGHTPTLTPFKVQACSPSGSEQARKTVVFSHPPPLTLASAPIKPCMNVLSDHYQFLYIGEGQEPWLISIPHRIPM